MTERTEALMLLALLGTSPADVETLLRDMKEQTGVAYYDEATLRQRAGYIRDTMGVQGIRIREHAIWIESGPSFAHAAMIVETARREGELELAA